MIIHCLPLDVFKSNAIGDCTNNGISSHYDRILVEAVDGFVEVDTNDPPENLFVEKSLHFGVRDYDYLEPFKKCPSNMIGYMSGGNFAYTCDSRFLHNYPLSIHDRCESIELYNSMY